MTELSLYDIVHAPGVAIDLNHIDTTSKVTGFLPDNDGLKKALTGTDIVVIPAGRKYLELLFSLVECLLKWRPGIARKPGMTRDGKSKSRLLTTLISKFRRSLQSQRGSHPKSRDRNCEDLPERIRPHHYQPRQ